MYDGSGSDGLKLAELEPQDMDLRPLSQSRSALIMVLNGMKSSGERKRESRKLLEWGFREYDNYNLFHKEEIVTEIDVWLGKDKRLSARVNEEIKLTVRLDSSKVKTTVHYEEPVSAPIKKAK